ncbi:MAG: DUF1887 family protein [Clostridia bacterium]|nr:DUF1887 family protein [Clostridia bacterium]
MFFTKQDKREALPEGAIITLHAPDCDDVAQFQILSEVGRGGFAIMYIAKQLGVGERYVALKELFPASPDNSVASRRSDGRIVIYNPLIETDESDDEQAWAELGWYFANEKEMTKLAGRMLDEEGVEIEQNNPDVFSVSGPYLSDAHNRYLLISTYLGESLATYIDSGWYSEREVGSVPNRNFAEILDVLRKTSEKLSALHYNKLYHLDLSTSNIYLTRVDTSEQISSDRLKTPDPYIVDYGSAYDRERSKENDHRFTVNPFSSPEVRALAGIQKQDLGYEVDESSDTYSIAAILFYAIFGKYYSADVRRDDRWKDCIYQMYPAEYNGGFAEDLIGFLEIGLASDQMERFTDSNELTKALKALQKSYIDHQPLGHISADELMTYYLLDQHPLYQSKNKNGELEVLCLGSGVFVHRMVLSMLSVGQMSAHKLKIHIVSQDASAYRARLQASAPALTAFADLGDGTFPYAERESYVDFTFEDVPDLLNPTCCDAIAERYADCRYVVISLGKNSLNSALAQQYAKALGNVNYSVKIHYNTRADVARNQSAIGSTDGISPKIKLIEFPLSKKDYFKYVNKLAQRAFKVHYLYARLSSPKASREAARREFMGDAYSQCSSTAAAVHLKYKLADVGVTPMATYSERKRAIDRYLAKMEMNPGELIALEHRRWLMYMISLGYQNPTDEQIRDYCFTTYRDPQSNQIKQTGFKYPAKKLHHCLVPCDNRGLVLAGLSRGEWDHDEMPDGLDALDRRSLTVHRMAREKAIEKRPFILSGLAAMEQYLPDRSTEEGSALYGTYLELKSWLEGVLSQLVVEPVQEKLTAYREVLAPASANIAEEFSKIKLDLAPYIEYAAYKDYKLPDLELIENLLWIYYGSDEIDLIKLTGGREIDLIASALMIEPETVCYIGDTFNDNIELFFDGHGGNTQVSKLYCPSDDYERIVKTLCNRVSEHSVIDITGASDLYIAAATEVSIQTGTPLICCDSTAQKIINVRGFDIAPIYRLKNQITAEEAYLLFGVKRSEELQIGGVDYIHRINDRVDKLYQIYSRCKGSGFDSASQGAGQNGDSIHIDWDALVTFFMKVSKGSSEFRFKMLLPTAWGKSVHCHLDRVSKSFYENSIVPTEPTRFGADVFFEKLQNWGFISNFRKQSRTERHLTIQFDACTEELAKALKGFWNNSKWSDDSAQLNDYTKFNVKTGELLIDFTSGLYVKTNGQFLVKLGLDEQATKDALNALHEAGFVTMHDAADGVAFTYLTMADKECLTKAGNFLEALVWKKAIETGKFDDVAPNWCFDWNDGTSTKNELDVILTCGLSTIVVSCKSGNAKKEDLYEVKYLADRFSVNTKAVIVYSKEKMYEDGVVRDGIQAIRDRAKAMGVYLIDGSVLESGTLGQTLVDIAEGRSQLV